MGYRRSSGRGDPGRWHHPGGKHNRGARTVALLLARRRRRERRPHQARVRGAGMQRHAHAITHTRVGMQPSAWPRTPARAHASAHTRPQVRAGCTRSLWFGIQLPRAFPSVSPSPASPASVHGAKAAAGADNGGGNDPQLLELRVRLRLAPEGHAIDAATAHAAAAKASFARGLVPEQLEAAPTHAAGAGAAGRTVSTRLRLTMSGPPVGDSGDSRRWRLSRLRWLDSTAGATRALPHPFTPVASSEIPPRRGRSMLETVSHLLPSTSAICHHLPPSATICHHLPQSALPTPPSALISHPPSPTICPPNPMPSPSIAIIAVQVY